MMRMIYIKKLRDKDGFPFCIVFCKGSTINKHYFCAQGETCHNSFPAKGVKMHLAESMLASLGSTSEGRGAAGSREREPGPLCHLHFSLCSTSDLPASVSERR